MSVTRFESVVLSIFLCVCDLLFHRSVLLPVKISFHEFGQRVIRNCLSYAIKMYTVTSVVVIVGWTDVHASDVITALAPVE